MILFFVACTTNVCGVCELLVSFVSGPVNVDSVSMNALLFVVYLNRVHRDGNKVVLVHCVELPELSLNKARMCFCYCYPSVVFLNVVF